MKSLFLCCLLAAVVTLKLEADEPVVSRLVSIQGRVEFAVSGDRGWNAAPTGLRLNPGDRLRTRDHSRATIQLSDKSVIRLNQNTTLLIARPETDTKRLFQLDSGSIYFFNRERPADMEFRTPLSSGSIRGTEFLLASDPNETRLAVFDGEVLLKSGPGEASIHSGEMAVAEPGRAPSISPIIAAIDSIQWALHYPAVLPVSDLDLTDADAEALGASLDAYAQGAFAEALKPALEAGAESESGRLYQANLLLTVGRVDEAEEMLGRIDADLPSSRALDELIRTVRGESYDVMPEPVSAGGWLARSYQLQRRFKPAEALRAALRARDLAPGSGLALVRLAELQFNLDRRTEALRILERALDLSPRNAMAHALRGFALLGNNDVGSAAKSFEHAITLDGSLATGWLGRGLCRLARGDTDEGRRDLQVAAALEPDTSLLRSYLGKAFAESGDETSAEEDLRRAVELDGNDPTPWLYSAIFNHQRNRINDAVHDLEHSQSLNDNRSLFRSRLGLDHDQSVRGANLAAVYQDAGLARFGRRVASQAVALDHTNPSAHLFLANSYQALEDRSRFNLRHESARESELLTANLLAPVGGANLSQILSQQDHLRYFAPGPIRVSSITDYQGNGDWTQSVSAFGSAARMGYALDLRYTRLNGWRPNADFEERHVSLQLKYALTPRDQLYVQTGFRHADEGDVAQYFDPASAKRDYRFEEDQGPNLIAGYHHEWQPGSHTLFLAGRFEDHIDVADGEPNLLFLRQSGGGYTSIETAPMFSRTFESDFDLYSLELQQIWQSDRHTLIGGARYQTGEVNSSELLDRGLPGAANIVAGSADSSMERVSIYGYHHWQVAAPLRLVTGLSYDRLEHPVNPDLPPISSGSASGDLIAPKLGFIYQPTDHTTIRGAATRSLGGLFFDNSVSLEPTQVGGFNQTFRSLVPESVAGLVPGTEFETFGLGLDHRFGSGTYVGIEGEWLRSEGRRNIGALTNPGFPPVPDTPVDLGQKLDFQERAVAIDLQQLVGEQWSLGVRYRVADAGLESPIPEIADVAGYSALDGDVSSLLHQVSLHAVWNHPDGWFGSWESLWSHQDSDGYATPRDGDAFWHHNVFLGYRFPRRRAEVRIGILNLTDEDYRLNPLNLTPTLPRERTFTARLRIHF